MFKKGLVVSYELTNVFYYMINQELSFNIWSAFIMYSSIIKETLLKDNDNYIIITDIFVE